MLPIGQARVGDKIIRAGAPHEILTITHLNLGRGQAKVPSRLKNLLTGAIIDQTFQGGERVEPAEISYRTGQFLYLEGQQGFFMLEETFEQSQCRLAANQQLWLKEGQSVNLTFWQDQAITVNLPPTVQLRVEYAEPAVKGNTATDARKPATLETGAQITVPLFIKTGQLIRVKTETGSYDSRV
ncbi:MAG: elongation factor P [Patescibacteria group bacterium]